MQQSTVNRFRSSLLLQLTALALVLGWWLARGIPVTLEEPAPAASVLPCVSYAPFRRPGASPLDPDAIQARVTPAQIEEDLRILKAYTNCVRTYGLGHGLDALPAIAARLGMRVRLGAWIARDATQNRLEIERALALAQEFKGTVELLIIGNEVLLRRELPPAQLALHLDYARQRSPVPVTYADVWEFWLRHAWLAAHVDLVTVHILPYWEDDPVGVSDAVGHVLRVNTQVRKRFAGQPVWVGETGWPAAGRQRGAALPGRIEQARFVRELLQAAPGAALDYNLIEAFDQPWKRALEGAMGGYWGLFDRFGLARFAWRGAVVEDPSWWRGPLGSMLGALAGLVLAWRFARRACALPQERQGAWLAAAPLPLGAALLGALVPVQWLALQQWARTPWEWSAGILLACAGGALTLMVAGRLTQLGLTLPLTTAPAAAAAGTSSTLQGLDRGLSALRLVLLFCAASVALTLLFDARYRPFPWWWFAAPTASLVAWRLGNPQRRRAGPEAQLLAGMLALCAVAVALAEGWHNTQALAFCALLLVLAATVAGRFRSSTNSASSAAGAHRSVL